MSNGNIQNLQFAFRPTLLVGIGGVGCRIAASVYGMARKSNMLEQCRLSIIGFDTDENDYMKLMASQQMGSRSLILTSPARPVWNVLSTEYPHVSDWFTPLDSLTTELRQMNLRNGAGQIRMFSRLAFFTAMKDPDLKRRILWAVEHLTKPSSLAGDQPYSGTVNVLVTGTLAGGTGSGMFLQTALYLQKLLTDRGCQSEIRGLFLLPDVMIHAANIPANQIENVRSNGFSALRELHAILLQTANRSPVPVNFNYAPPNLSLKTGMLPFKNITLIDYENQIGGHLDGGLATYIHLAAQSAYCLLLTPIGGGQLSISANNARTKLAAAGQGQVNYYSGIGISSVIYPVEEILDYLSLNYGLRILNDEWLIMDRLFLDELRRWEMRRKSGDTSGQKPERGLSFIRNMDLAVDEGKPFFTDIRASVFRKRESKGITTIEPRFETYLNALEKEVLRIFWKEDPLLAQLKNEEEFSEAAESSSIEEIQDFVFKGEEKLKKWESGIREALRSRPRDIFHSIFVFSETSGKSEWGPHHIQTYILHDKVHPLEMRLFLYLLMELIKDRKEKLRITILEKALKECREYFDDPDTPGYVETAINKIHELMNKPKWKTFIKRELPKFERDYRSNFNSTMRTLKEFAAEKVKEHLYDLMEKQVVDLCRTAELFFDSLEKLTDRLNHEIKKNHRKHSPGVGVSHGNIYVYADENAKNQLLARLTPVFSSSEEGGGVKKALAEALYNRYKSERDKDPFSPLAPFNAGLLFRKEVIDGFCRTDLEQHHQAAYRMTAVEAIQAEAKLKNQNFSTYFQWVTDMIGNQAQPYLRLKNQGTSIVFWALSPSNGSQLDNLINYLGNRTGTSAMVDSFFPDNELLCIACNVNLDPSYLVKLNSSSDDYGSVEGEYYQTYKSLVDRILQSQRQNPTGPIGLFTPHLDKEWHYPGTLPELTPGQTRVTIERLMDAYVLAVATSRLEKVTKRGKPQTLYRDWTRAGYEDETRILSHSHDDMVILEKFIRDASAVQSTMDCAETWRKYFYVPGSHMLADSLEESGIYKGLCAPEALFNAVYCDYQIELLLKSNAPTSIVTYRQICRNDAQLIVDRLFRKIGELFAQTHKTSSRETQVDKAINAVKAQVEGLQQSEGYLKLSSDVQKRLKEIADAAFDRIKEMWEAEIQ